MKNKMPQTGRTTERMTRSWIAAGVATILLAASGLAYRGIAEQYTRAPESVHIPKGTLGRLPLNIAEWIGHDVRLDDAIVQATDTDDHVNRSYMRRNGQDRVGFFVAYGVRLRDLTPHRPEVCYPGSGWTADGAQVVELQLSNGSLLPCRILRFFRGGLKSSKITVLNFYIVDGQYSPDVALLRSKLWRPDASAQYVAQIQITASADEISDRAGELVKSFAINMAAEIQSLLAEAVSETTRTAVITDDDV